MCLTHTVMKHNFKNLDIWQRSRQFVKEIYLITKSFPSEERYGLISQIRKAAVSMPSNIAEGCGRSTKPQLIHFLDIAIASSCEVETQLYLSYDLEYVNQSEMKRLTDEVTQIRRMTIRFQNTQRKI